MSTNTDTDHELGNRRLFALKEGDTFLVADAWGDLSGNGDGLFRNDTRVLSGWRLRLGGRRPTLLSSGVSQDNVYFTAHFSNHPLPVLGETSLPEGVIHIERKRLLWQGRLYEQLSLRNFSSDEAEVPLTVEFAADFVDMFEVRGQRRPQHGEHLAPTLDAERHGVAFRYLGLDGQLRASVVSFSAPPVSLTAESASFSLQLAPGDDWSLYVEVGAESHVPSARRFRHAAAQARRDMRVRQRRGAQLHTSGRLFQAWLDKSRADLALLTTELPTGPYPYAGVPWFSTPFGRDAIITALQTLWLDPALAAGVLTFLADHQAQETSSFRDAQPGKIMHETRKGEMSAINEVPFARYYGGVDTTPLFIILAGAYARRTGDTAFIDGLWPALEAAAAWITNSCDAHPQGLLAYARGEQTGLLNQGWKDSHDSVFHADGRSPSGPVALVEVQGYAWAAYETMAELTRRRGDAAAIGWTARAARLREAVEATFWLPERQFYALAVDGNGEPCAVRTSNAGHLLYLGLPTPERGQAVVRQLLGRSFNTGWGIRTLAQEAIRFNPMSYHNGSVWPHDMALCAAGAARYHEREGVVRLLAGLFEAAAQFGMRLPELFCGFARAPGESPIAYPVACLPQAWAAGAVFMLLQACLGVEIDATNCTVRVVTPRLPAGIDHLELRGLAVGGQLLDLVFQRAGNRTVCFVERQRGHGNVTVEVTL